MNKSRGEVRPFRLAVVFHGLAPYRSALYDHIYDAVAPAGGQVTVIAAGGKSTFHPWEQSSLRPKRASSVSIPLHRKQLFGRAISFPDTALWKTLDVIDPTHLWLHEFSPFSILGLIWGKTHRRVSVISTEIGDDFTPFGDYQAITPLQKFNQELQIRASDGILACTKKALHRAERLGKDAILAPHAVDTQTFHPLQHSSSSESVRFLQVGSFIPRKGGDLLLKSFSIAEKLCPNISLTFLGGGDPSLLTNEAVRLGIAAKVKFISFAEPEKVKMEYLNADVFVLASLAETYGVVVHEAAASGLPLLISDKVGAAEVLISNEHSGLLFDPENIEETAKKIARLASDSKLRDILSAAARKSAEAYCVRKTASKIADWLLQLPSRP